MPATAGRALISTFLFAAPLVAQPARLTLAPARPDPGALARVTLDRIGPRNDSVVAIRGTMAGEPLHFIRASPGVWHAIGGMPVDASDSIVTRVVLERLSGAKDTIGITLATAHVPPPEPAGPSRGRVRGARRLTVDRVFTQPMDAATEARVERENAIVRAIGHQSHNFGPLWSQPFLRPRSSTITSTFGSGRVFNGRLASRHLGVDFRGTVGESVYAANRGVVALVSSFFLAGNVIYIDHGAGVVTGYFHLSEQLVKVGDAVERGQEIGRVGATGRVTGPHLHWSARYGAVTIDPLDLVALSTWYAAPEMGSERH
jgi:murein DD-endopeptidase MepM/ murein hydrolase activator NlpD